MDRDTAGVHIINPHMHFSWDSGLLTKWNFYLEDIHGQTTDISLQVREKGREQERE